LRHAFAEAPQAPTRLLQGLPADRHPLLRQGQEPSSGPRHRPARLPSLRPSRWPDQADYRSHAASLLRHTLAGSRSRSPHHPGFAGPPQPANHGPVHLRVDGEGRSHAQPVGPPRRHPDWGSEAMTAQTLELADILREYAPAFLEAYGDTVSPQ